MENNSKEKKLGYISLMLAGIILVLCVITVVLFNANLKYNVLYEEALQTQLEMQEVINQLENNANNVDSEE